MKILHINSYYFAGKFYKHLYEMQIKQNLDISVYAPASFNSDCEDFDYGSYCYISRNHSKYDRIIFSLKHNKIVKDIKQKYAIESYDIMHAHSLFSNGFIAYEINREYKVPYITAVRNTDINVFFKRMIHLRKLGIRILKNSCKIIFLSQPYRDTLLEKYVPDYLKAEILNKSIILPNGIDAFWLENINNSKQYPNEKEVKIIYAGAVDRNKNLTATVKAVNILISKGYKAKYTAVGKIADKNIYKAITKYPFVKYIPKQPKEELIKLYRQNDIFVMPSVTETFGLVYCEAMSQALPVIYSKGQGFDKQFNEGIVGYHVNSHDAAEIAKKIEDILKNYRNISQNCIRLCKKFDWDKISAEYRNIYNVCIKKDCI